jgi:hypothetical protein
MTVLVPKDLLDGYERLSERHRRLLVAGWLLDPNGRRGGVAFREAACLWAPAALARPAKLTVLSVLLELAELGAVGDVNEDGDFFVVETRKAVA